jgi:hypothetical protein
MTPTTCNTDLSKLLVLLNHTQHSRISAAALRLSKDNRHGHDLACGRRSRRPLRGLLGHEFMASV